MPTALIVLPPIIFPAWIILWHIILMLQRTGPNKPNTISAHAEQKPKILLIHRLSHGLPVIAILPFVFGFLFPQGFRLAGIILVTAALFDLIEVVTLRSALKSNSSDGSGGLVHKTFAWLMAISYLVYAVVISSHTGLGMWLYGIVLLLSASIFAVFLALKTSTKKHFYILQMTFYTLTTFVILMSHISILSKMYF